MANDEPQCSVMTTAAGVPVAANQNSLTAGVRGSGSVTDTPSGAR